MFLASLPLSVRHISSYLSPIFNHRLSRFLIAEAVNASHRPSATDNVLEAYQLRKHKESGDGKRKRKKEERKRKTEKRAEES